MRKRLMLLLIAVFGLLSLRLDPQSKPPVIKDALRRLSPLLAPDTVNESYLFGVGCAVCTEDGKLVFADNMKGAILVFSIDGAKELYKFGGRGKGPGEFESVFKLKIVGGNILAMDDRLMRCTLYDMSGHVLRTIKLPFRASDVVLLGSDSLLACTYRFDDKFKPLKIVRISTGEIVRELGYQVDVQKGLMQKFMNLFPKNKDIYQSRIISAVLLSGGKKILTSQLHPYAVFVYDLVSGVTKDVTEPIDLDVEDKIVVQQYRETGVSFDSRLPSGVVLPPQIAGNYVCIPIFSLDRQKNYLDCYDLAGRFAKRLRIPPFNSSTIPVTAMFRGTKEMLILTADKLGVVWFERLSLNLN